MQRDKWTFDIVATELAKAATAKREHHESRLGFWRDASEKTMKEIREKGISVEDSLAGPNYSNKSSGYGPQIVVDQTFQRQLNEASGKIDEHTKKVAEYVGWEQVLQSNAGRTYSLNADDYLYFFGK